MNQVLKSIQHPIIGIVIRAFIGCFFIFSAITKLQVVDWFELYLYSLELFNDKLSSMAARFVIGFELLLGVWWLSFSRFRVIYKLTLFVLVAFSGFLLYRVFEGDTGNCFCFGTYVALSPLASLFKNVSLIAVVWATHWYTRFQIRLPSVLLGLVFSIVFLAPFFISPPDFIYNKIYPGKVVDNPNFISISDTTLAVDEGKKVVAFFSTSCKFCVMAAQKISVVARRMDIADNIRFVFYGDSTSLAAFWEVSESTVFRHTLLPFEEIERITKGRMPTIFFLKNGIVWRKTDYRELSDAHFTEFFDSE